MTPTAIWWICSPRSGPWTGTPPWTGIDGIIARYGLSDVSTHGYAHYRCDGATGLAAYNREPYLRLRRDFNQRVREGRTDDYSNILFYVLIVYAFNNQIPLQQPGGVQPPGRQAGFQRPRCAGSSPDSSTASSLRTAASPAGTSAALTRRAWVRGIWSMPTPPISSPAPPTTSRAAGARRTSGIFLDLLDGLHRRQIRFALSNVLRSKGRENRDPAPLAGGAPGLSGRPPGLRLQQLQLPHEGP